MTTELYTVDGLASVDEAMRLMRQHAVSSLVVSRRDKDDEVGLLEVADVAAEVVAKNRPPGARKRVRSDDQASGNAAARHVGALRSALAG